MCGINGIVTENDEIKRKIQTMNKILRHRGPDDEGFVLCSGKDKLCRSYSGDDSITPVKEKLDNINKAVFGKFDIILGHRRLSIIDLSEKGHGPMSDTDKKIWLTYNGEIYNYIELREELRSAGYNFQSNSDTEVIIYSYLHWGTDCLNHFNGMWGFAIYDSRDSSFFLARDRFGVKPLYFTLTPEYFAFSSEIKPLVYLNPESFKVNKQKIPFFILYGNRLNTEETYIENIFSLPPAHFMVFKNASYKIKQFYDIHTGKAEREKKPTEKLLELLTDSIKLRFRSDVPVGTCLSGGFDSSSIVSISSSIHKNSLNTISAVWTDKECDESRYIDVVNKNFNCIENKVEPDPEKFAEEFDKISYYQEIPTEGPGLYPQWYVMKKAKEKIKVLLDGQGGDEVFGGYFGLPIYLQSLLKDHMFKKALKEFRNYKIYLNKKGLHSFSGWMFPHFYNKIIRSHLSSGYKIFNKNILDEIKKTGINFDIQPPKIFNNYLNNLSYHYIRSLTIPTLLHYEDRASMAQSIESRVPFLDYRLVEFGLNLEPDNLVYKSTSRPLFRAALKNKIPEEIVNRKDKMGYPTPFGKWTRTILKPYINSIFFDANSNIKEYLNIDFLQKTLDEHYSGKLDYTWEIWRILSLEKFLALYKNKEFVK